MANKVLVIGASGGGKSTSLRNLDPKTTGIANTIGKPLPFKGWKKHYTPYDGKTTGNLIECSSSIELCGKIKTMAINKPELKVIVVDDSQYTMSYEFMARAKETGFQKFTEIGKNMFDLLTVGDNLRDDLTIVYLAHSEDVSANGYTKTKMKTIGKMLDEKITVEGLFSVVLLAYAVKKDKTQMEYVFVTQSNGTTTAKSPMGMFDSITVPNDLNEVLKTMENYYEGE